MKKIIYISILTLFIGFSSCVDLDKYPIDELSEASYWKTPLDAEMYITQVYKCLPGVYTGNTDGDKDTDNARHGIKWAAGNLAVGVYDPMDFGWATTYSNIRICNVLLDKINTIDNYPIEDKEKVMAEARFFRAYLYFGLMRDFGDVPYVDKELSIAESKEVTRTPREEVYKKTMEDFDYAIEKLPDSWPSAKDGRATKGAARSMKAIAALYFKDYEVAAKYANDVIQSNKYELFDAEGTGLYEELFWEKQDDTNEGILVRKFDSKIESASNYIIGWGAFPPKGWGGLNPTQSLVDAFECIDGAPISKSTLYNEKDPFKNRDPRLEVNILHDGEVLYGVTIKVKPLESSGSTGIGQHGDATATGYYAQKYLDPSIDPQSGGWNMGKDCHVIRFAEVLLIYAEAKNELSPLDASAFEAVNRVRKRVSMPPLQKTDPSKPTYCATQDDLRQRIRNEWRVEFALEGNKRFWDIRRWGIAKEVLNTPFLGIKLKEVKDTSGKIIDYLLYEGENLKLINSKYEDHNYIFPVPQREIDLNPNLTQNPGYK